MTAITIIVVATAITAALVAGGIMTESLELRAGAFLFAYFVGSRGLMWSIEAWKERQHR